MSDPQRGEGEHETFPPETPRSFPPTTDELPDSEPGERNPAAQSVAETRVRTRTEGRAAEPAGIRRHAPARGQREDTTLRGGLVGIAAVALATLVISLAGLLISLVVALLY